jgi:hypothetical protein
MRLRRQITFPDEAIPAGPTAPPGHRQGTVRVGWRERLGGTEGNEILTSATAALLVVLLAAEGITIIRMGGLVGAHMFIGLILIPPALLKIASTGLGVAPRAGSRFAWEAALFEAALAFRALRMWSLRLQETISGRVVRPQDSETGPTA